MECVFRLRIPLPLRPTNRISLKTADPSVMYPTLFRNSPQKFSSFPADMVTFVPSGTSPPAETIRKMPGRDLLALQCGGSGEERMLGLPVRIRSDWITSGSTSGEGKDSLESGE